MTGFEIELIAKEEVARDTVALTFTKPKDFEYKAGQYVSMTLLSLKDQGPREATRSMSLASAPSEDVLIITMRLGRSKFKQAIADMKVKDRIEIRGPLGNLVLSEQKKDLIFIAGGIGIAPFRGMIIETLNNKTGCNINLLYCNKLPADASFLDDLKNLENNNFKCTPTFTRTDSGGRIDSNFIKKHCSNYKKAQYYIVGLPEMVTDMNMMLHELGISQEDIETEQFTGY